MSMDSNPAPPDIKAHAFHHYSELLLYLGENS